MSTRPLPSALPTSPDVIVFDFDGTLIDSAPAILSAFAAALEEKKLTPCVPLDATLIGPPLKETLMRLSGCEDSSVIDSLSSLFKKHYDTQGVLTTRPYPGVDGMLQHFRATGAALHLCTNKRLSVTQAILEHLGWQADFISVYALDMTEPRLPGKAQLLAKQIAEQGLRADRAIYVGDKHEDGLAANANGMPFHYVAWGYGELQREQMEPTWTWVQQPEHVGSGLSLAAHSDEGSRS
jgi:phosphoglycolate phosphatase